MLTNILLGTLMMVVTTLVHSIFMVITLTTLGYGDIVLTEQWRLLAAIEAANGIIMFGWSTALVIAVVQRTFASLLRRIHERRSS